MVSLLFLLNLLLVYSKVFNDQQQEMAVVLHNWYRSKDKLAPYQAWSMNALTWENGLAEVADQHAKKCVRGHAYPHHGRYGENYGQNVGRSVVKSTEDEEINSELKNLMETWSKDERNDVYNSIKAFHEVRGIKLEHPNRFGQMSSHYSHYAQVILDTDTEVGCAYHICEEVGGNMLYLVCNYGPSRITDKEGYFEIGEPCNNLNGHCRNGKVCQEDYGLCFSPTEKYFWESEFLNVLKDETETNRKQGTEWGRSVVSPASEGQPEQSSVVKINLEGDYYEINILFKSVAQFQPEVKKELENMLAAFREQNKKFIESKEKTKSNYKIKYCTPTTAEVDWANAVTSGYAEIRFKLLLNKDERITNLLTNIHAAMQRFVEEAEEANPHPSDQKMEKAPQSRPPNSLSPQVDVKSPASPAEEPDELQQGQSTSLSPSQAAVGIAERGGPPAASELSRKASEDAKLEESRSHREVGVSEASKRGDRVALAQRSNSLSVFPTDLGQAKGSLQDVNPKYLLREAEQSPAAGSWEAEKPGYCIQYKDIYNSEDTLRIVQAVISELDKGVGKKFSGSDSLEIVQPGQTPSEPLYKERFFWSAPHITVGHVDINFHPKLLKSVRQFFSQLKKSMRRELGNSLSTGVAVLKTPGIPGLSSGIVAKGKTSTLNATDQERFFSADFKVTKDDMNVKEVLMGVCESFHENLRRDFKNSQFPSTMGVKEKKREELDYEQTLTWESTDVSSGSVDIRFDRGLTFWLQLLTQQLTTALQELEDVEVDVTRPILLSTGDFLSPEQEQDLQGAVQEAENLIRDQQQFRTQDPSQPSQTARAPPHSPPASSTQSLEGLKSVEEGGASPNSPNSELAMMSEEEREHFKVVGPRPPPPPSPPSPRSHKGHPVPPSEPAPVLEPSGSDGPEGAGPYAPNVGGRVFMDFGRPVSDPASLSGAFSEQKFDNHKFTSYRRVVREERSRDASTPLSNSIREETASLSGTRTEDSRSPSRSGTKSFLAREKTRSEPSLTPEESTRPASLPSEDGWTAQSPPSEENRRYPTSRVGEACSESLVSDGSTRVHSHLYGETWGDLSVVRKDRRSEHSVVREGSRKEHSGVHEEQNRTPEESQVQYFVPPGESIKEPSGVHKDSKSQDSVVHKDSKSQQSVVREGSRKEHSVVRMQHFVPPGESIKERSVVHKDSKSQQSVVSEGSRKEHSVVRTGSRSEHPVVLEEQSGTPEESRVQHFVPPGESIKERSLVRTDSKSQHSGVRKENSRTPVEDRVAYSPLSEGSRKEHSGVVRQGSRKEDSVVRTDSRSEHWRVHDENSRGLVGSRVQHSPPPEENIEERSGVRTGSRSEHSAPHGKIIEERSVILKESVREIPSSSVEDRRGSSIPPEERSEKPRSRAEGREEPFSFVKGVCRPLDRECKLRVNLNHELHIRLPKVHREHGQLILQYN